MSIDLEPAKLLSLHGLTKDVSQFCQRHLKTQIDAMAPLFRPRRFLGDHIDSTGKEAVAGADRNLAELQELFARVAVKPFDLRPELRKPLESVSTQFQLDEWEYTHATETDRGWNSIRVTTPLTWVFPTPRLIRSAPCAVLCRALASAIQKPSAPLYCAPA